MTLKKVTSVLALALMLLVTAPPKPSAAGDSHDQRSPQRTLLAQAQPTVTLPDSLPQGATVRIDGSSAMQVINQALQQSFQQRYPGSTVNLEYQGSTPALQALAEGKIDLAAIARPLTEAEKAQGFTEVSVSRNKIAVIVDPANPYRGNLTLTDFVKMFRGEITDWSQLGGAAGVIRLVDRPESSDTRQAFGRYVAFSEAGGLSTGTAVSQVEDTTDAVIQSLGSDGVGYAIANQVEQRQDVQIVKMHNTLPNDSRYPFSQPLTYVYKDEAGPAVAAFLAYATNPDGQQVIDQAKQQEAAAAGAVGVANSNAAIAGVATPNTTSTAGNAVATLPPTGVSDAVSTTASGLPLALLWLLPLGLLGLVLLGWWKRRRAMEAIAETERAAVLAQVSGQPAADSVDLVARTGSVIAADRVSIGNRPSVLPVEPVVVEPVEPLAQPVAESPEPFFAGQSEPMSQSTVSGMTAPDGEPSRVDTGTNTGTDSGTNSGTNVNWSAVGAGATALGTAALVGRGGSQTESGVANSEEANSEEANSGVVNSEGANSGVVNSEGANSEGAIANPAAPSNAAPIPPISTEAITTNANPEGTRFTPTASNADDASLNPTGLAQPSPGSSATFSGATSGATESPQASTPSQSGLAASFPAAASLGLGAVAASQAVKPANQTPAQSAVEASKYDVGQTDLSAESLASVDADLPDLPEGYGSSRIVLMPQSPQWAYAYWDIPNESKVEAKQQGGDRLALRFYDVTEVDLSRQNPHSLQEYECDELARDWYVPIPVSDRDYIAEIGYVTVEGRWLMLARSQPARIPPIYPSDWYEEKFLNVPWNEDLQGRQFVTLLSPTEKRNGSTVALYNIAQGAEAQRLAGSLYGSMQQAAGASEAVSSFSMFTSGSGITASGGAIGSMSGIGMSGYTTSGVGMSGVGMSGVGMSGVGMSGYTTSGIGMSGVGLFNESGVGMYTTSGMGMYTTSGIGLYSQSGVGMYTTSGMGLYSQSGMGMYTTSGMGLYSQSGMGMYTTSGMGLYSQSGVGMYTTSGMGMYTTSGVGLYSQSGVGMYTTSGMGLYSESGVGLYSMSGAGFIGSSASVQPVRPRQFWLVADAELIVYGATEPNAVVTIGGQPVKLNPDGTFRFQMSFQDGLIDFPIMAVAVDGEQSRAIHMKFERETPSRNTNTKAEAKLEWIEEEP